MLNGTTVPGSLSTWTRRRKVKLPMENVVRISQSLEKEVLAVLAEIEKITTQGELKGIAVVVELASQEAPLSFTLGSYHRDPFRALASLERLRARLLRRLEPRTRFRDTM